MADIQTKMKVECTDGECGKSTHLIVDPQSGKLTHFVVKGKQITDTPDRPDRLVAVEKIISTVGGVIQLDCTVAEVAAMRPFTAIHYHQKGLPDYADSVMPGGMKVSEPLPPTPKDSWTVKQEEEYVPTGEVAISQDMTVQTEQDGKVGQVDGLVVDPDSGEVTHLLMRKGHLWGARDVAIPVSAMEKADEDNVYLNIDKAAIKELPSVKLK